MSAVIAQLEARHAALALEITEVETAIRVLKRLNPGVESQPAKPLPPLFEVRRTGKVTPAPARKPGRASGADYLRQAENAARIRDQVMTHFAPGLELPSGMVLDLMKVRGDKKRTDQVYNALTSLMNHGLLIRDPNSYRYQRQRPAAEDKPGEERAA